MRIIGKITYGIFILLIIGVAGLFLASLLPIPGNVEIKIVKSGSMEPKIRTGSIVVIKPINIGASYAVGDIITFGKDTKQSIPTTHRIIEIEEKNGMTFYKTKGDANEDLDPQETPRKEVIGKVLFTVPYAGFILDFAKKPTGFALMIGVPAGIVIFDELVTIWMETKNMVARKRKKSDGDDSSLENNEEHDAESQIIDLRNLNSIGRKNS